MGIAWCSLHFLAHWLDIADLADLACVSFLVSPFDGAEPLFRSHPEVLYRHNVGIDPKSRS